MEDAKLQVLHDTLSQIRGKNGLGTNTQFSWQRGTGATQTATRHPLALHLPDNALYAHFLPEGVYDPASNNIDYGDGRIIKRDFSDAIIDGDVANKSKKRKRKVDSEEKATGRRKEIRKAEKKAAKKVEKLKAKREAKLEEKKRQKKLEKKIKKEQSSEVASRTPAKQLDLSKNNNIAETAAKPSNSNNKNHMIEINKEIEQKEAKKRKKAKITMS